MKNRLQKYISFFISIALITTNGTIVSAKTLTAHSVNQIMNQNQHIKATNVNNTMNSSSNMPSSSAKKTDVKISGNTGWNTTFGISGLNEDGIDINAENYTMSMGIGSKYKSELELDPAVAKTLFSVPDWKNYVQGTITRNST